MPVLPIGSAFRWLTDQEPDRPAVTCDGVTRSRAELEASSNRLARAYAALGVREGDLVTIGLPNGIEFYEAALATWKLGATPQPVSSRLPLLERQAIVDLADPALLVGIDPADHPGRRTVPPGFEPDLALSNAPVPDRAAPSIKAMTSGGSTGRPKLIVATQRGEVDPEKAPGFGQRPLQVQLVPGPLYHNAPFIFSARGLLSGGHLVVMRRFDASPALELAERHRVQYILLVPTMMHRIWRLPEHERVRRDLSALHTILHLAAPCPPWLKEAWIDWLGPDRVLELYAGTEAQGATVITGHEWLEHRGSVGRPIRTCEMTVRDENGELVPPGEVGEIWIRPVGVGPTYHYIGATVRERDGWESLGDMGSMDADGYLYLADRRTDMILAGGANIYPAEVEAALDEHPAVGSSAVVGLPDPDLGQRVHAVVHLRREVSDDELRAFLAERLVRYKIPRSFERVPEPVRDDAGKVRRSQLAAERSAAGT